MKNLSTIEKVAIALGIAFVGFLGYRFLIKPAIANGGEGGSLIGSGATIFSSENTGIGTRISSRCTAQGPPNCSKVLSIGSEGLEVCKLQQYLNNSPSSSQQLVVDGIFGPLTEAELNRQTLGYQTTLMALDACL